MVDAQLIDDDLEIIDILKALKNEREKLWLWQPKGTSESRAVHYGVIRRCDIMKKLIEIVPTRAKGFKFSSPRELFLFSERRCIACKVKVQEYEGGYLTFVLPDRMNLMPGDFLEKFKIVEPENEQKFSHLRQLPRRAAKGGQMLGLLREDEESDRLDYFSLYDISQGGMGFRAEDPGEFLVGDKVIAVEIDGKPLPKKLRGEVVAVRQMEDENNFKIGVKFIT